MSMTTRTAIGPHPVEFEGDTLRLRLVGPLTIADAELLRVEMQALRRSLGTCFLLADAAELAGIDAEARRYLARWSAREQSERITGAAVYGVSFAMRTIITLTVNAIRVIGRREVQIAFANDEAEARRWIAARRAAVTDPAPEP